MTLLPTTGDVITPGRFSTTILAEKGQSPSVTTMKELGLRVNFVRESNLSPYQQRSLIEFLENMDLRYVPEMVILILRLKKLRSMTELENLLGDHPTTHSIGASNG